MPSGMEWSLIKDICWDHSKKSKLRTSAQAAAGLAWLPLLHILLSVPLAWKGSPMTRWGWNHHGKSRQGGDEITMEIIREKSHKVFPRKKIKICKWKKTLILNDSTNDSIDRICNLRNLDLIFKNLDQILCWCFHLLNNPIRIWIW